MKTTKLLEVNSVISYQRTSEKIIKYYTNMRNNQQDWKHWVHVAALVMVGGWVSLILSSFQYKEGNDRMTVRFNPDTVTVLKNPLTGWVMYLGRGWDENFWDKYHYDEMSVHGGDSTVRVSDYAGTCYLRINWNMLEEQEDKYAWNDPDSRIYKLLASVRSRGMRLAFRINVDSRDQGQNTPLYVKEAGAKGFQDPNNPQLWSPYPDDSIFQQKYEKFLKAFAAAFDDPDKVDFVDAYGLGKWGEAHGVKYQDYANKAAVFEWITDAYSSAFKRVPLVINYHRLVGDTISWADPHPDSERLLKRAIEKGYILRHDAFGMTGYYGQWERSFAESYRYRLPILMEGGWITGAHHRYWRDPSGNYRMDHSEDVRRGEYEESRQAHVNMMDLRTGDEVRSWFNTSFDLVRRFEREGGYRLYPSAVSFDVKSHPGSWCMVEHTWNNLGWGYCPTNIPQWRGKYKVCIALMDADGFIPIRQLVDEADLSTWLKGEAKTYQTKIHLQGIRKGHYTWLIGLVDTTKSCRPALRMALDADRLYNGWCVVGTLDLN